MKIQQVRSDIFEGNFVGLIVYDEKGNKYKISKGLLYGFLEGRKIEKTRKARVYYHIDKIGEK